MKVVSIVGARPQFVKAAAVSRRLRAEHTEILVHTGQHDDPGLSDAFFEELEIPPPDVNLGVGSGPRTQQIPAMARGIAQVLETEGPDWVLVYGDTNSTLAGALAAASCAIPIAHVEAGLRSFNRAMPEEINRVETDHLSSLHLCPSETAVANLAAEGITRHVHLTGDVTLDLLHRALPRSQTANPLRGLRIPRKQFVLATVHRRENTSDSIRLRRLLGVMSAIAEPVVFPVHPGTRDAIAAIGGWLHPHVHLMEPLGYVDMLALTMAARIVMTDSGGLQKEAYWLGVPCITLRDETEWVETVAAGWNIIGGTDPDRILTAVRSWIPPASRPALYGDGQAAARCVALLAEGT